jgi:hypothetical protein
MLWFVCIPARGCDCAWSVGHCQHVGTALVSLRSSSPSYASTPSSSSSPSVTEAPGSGGGGGPGFAGGMGIGIAVGLVCGCCGCCVLGAYLRRRHGHHHRDGGANTLSTSLVRSLLRHEEHCAPQRVLWSVATGVHRWWRWCCWLPGAVGCPAVLSCDSGAHGRARPYQRPALGVRAGAGWPARTSPTTSPWGFPPTHPRNRTTSPTHRVRSFSLSPHPITCD